jgi:hypothetical protein
VRRNILTTGLSEDPDRATLVGDPLDDSPGLLGMQIEVAGLIQPTQDQVGQNSNLVRQGHVGTRLSAGLIKDSLNPSRVLPTVEVDDDHRRLMVE